MNNHLKGVRRRGLRTSGAGRRRALLLGGSLIGASAAAVMFAFPAGAVVGPSANSIIIGTGSSTDYNMMQGLDTLFNDVPGCPMFVPFPSASHPQQLNFVCDVAPTPSTYPNNPFNDAAVEEARSVPATVSSSWRTPAPTASTQTPRVPGSTCSTA